MGVIAPGLQGCDILSFHLTLKLIFNGGWLVFLCPKANIRQKVNNGYYFSG